jgi:hypothetical protein
MEIHNEKSGRVGSHEGGVKLDLVDQVHAIHSREDLVAFLYALSHTLDAKPEWWENADLASFLTALARWLQDMEGYYLGRGEPVPETPSWKVIGDMLMAATMYE